MAELTTENKTRRTLGEVIDDHPKTVFFTRVILWLFLAGGLPFMFIAYRFSLFKAVSKIQIGGWGIIAIVIVAIVTITLLKYLKAYLNAGYSFWGQCLNGFCKIIIPLVSLYIIIVNIRNNLDLFLQALGCVILCELVAIPVNPFPKAIWDRQKNIRAEERKEGMDYFVNELFKRKENSDKTE